MRKRIAQLDIEDVYSLTPWLLLVAALGYGLVVWILSVSTIIFFDFARLRVFWLEPTELLAPNFPIFVACGLMFATLLTVLALTEWATGVREVRQGAVCYLAGLAVVVAWGINFYGLASIPLNDDWYFNAIQNEPFDPYRVHLGQIQERQPCGSCPPGLSIAVVELEIAVTVTIEAPTTQIVTGGIVSINEHRGRYTGAQRYEFFTVVETEDPEYFRRRWFLNK